MLNPNDVGLLREIQRRINYALHEDLAAENSQSSAWCDTGDGVHIWFLLTIAEANLGIHQYPAICERLGCQPDEEMSISSYGMD